MTLLVSRTYFPEASIPRNEEPTSPAAQSIITSHGEVIEAQAAPLLLSPTSSVATPVSPVPSHRRGVDEEVGTGISPLPPIYTRDVPPRHSVVAISPQSTTNLLISPTEPPPPPEDEPLPEYSRYPKSEAEAVTAAYRGDDSSTSAGGIKICGIYMRTLVTGVIILITACVIAGGVVGYQVKNGWLGKFQKSEPTNVPIATGYSGDIPVAPPSETWTSSNFDSGDGDGIKLGYPEPTPTTTATPTAATRVPVRLRGRAPIGIWRKG